MLQRYLISFISYICATFQSIHPLKSYNIQVNKGISCNTGTTLDNTVIELGGEGGGWGAYTLDVWHVWFPSLKHEARGLKTKPFSASV